MTTAIGSALSGIAAASKRIDVSASNIANQSSTAMQVGGVTSNKSYIPKDVVQISLGAGGVRTEVRESLNPTVKYFDPTSPQAGKDGFVETPNVDVAEELVEQRIASYDFKANLKSIQVADRLQQNLLDILG
ncbi:MAG: flagellar basal body rod C-terminal domain-containing protein [Rickettsiales bacterium]|jgi:flagellar basal-body rod protein FlgC